MVPAARICAAVVFGQQIDQQVAILANRLLLDGQFARIRSQVVDEQDGVVAPVIAQAQHCGVGRWQHCEIAPPYFGNFLAHPARALEPVERRIRVAPLRRDVDVLEAVGTAGDDRHDGLVRHSKSAMRLVGPLHRRSSAIAFGQTKIIPHRDLVAVTQHRRAG